MHEQRLSSYNMSVCVEVATICGFNNGKQHICIGPAFYTNRLALPSVVVVGSLEMVRILTRRVGLTAAVSC